MIVVMKAGALQIQIDHIIREIENFGYQPHPIFGVERTVIGAIGDEKTKWHLMDALAQEPGVEQVIPIVKPYKLASTEIKKEKSCIKISESIAIGGNEIVVIAGPCSVETREQIFHTAEAVK